MDPVQVNGNTRIEELTAIMKKGYSSGTGSQCSSASLAERIRKMHRQTTNTAYVSPGDLSKNSNNNSHLKDLLDNFYNTAASRSPQKPSKNHSATGDYNHNSNSSNAQGLKGYVANMIVKKMSKEKLKENQENIQIFAQQQVGSNNTSNFLKNKKKYAGENDSSGFGSSQISGVTSPSGQQYMVFPQQQQQYRQDQPAIIQSGQEQSRQALSHSHQRPSQKISELDTATMNGNGGNPVSRTSSSYSPCTRAAMQYQQQQILAMPDRQQQKQPLQQQQQQQQQTFLQQPRQYPTNYQQEQLKNPSAGKTRPKTTTRNDSPYCNDATSNNPLSASLLNQQNNSSAYIGQFLHKSGSRDKKSYYSDAIISNTQLQSSANKQQLLQAELSSSYLQQQGAIQISDLQNSQNPSSLAMKPNFEQYLTNSTKNPTSSQPLCSPKWKDIGFSSGTCSSAVKKSSNVNSLPPSMPMTCDNKRKQHFQFDIPQSQSKIGNQNGNKNNSSFVAVQQQQQQQLQQFQQQQQQQQQVIPNEIKDLNNNKSACFTGNQHATHKGGYSAEAVAFPTSQVKPRLKLTISNNQPTNLSAIPMVRNCQTTQNNMNPTNINIPMSGGINAGTPTATAATLSSLKINNIPQTSQNITNPNGHFSFLSSNNNTTKHAQVPNTSALLSQSAIKQTLLQGRSQSNGRKTSSNEIEMILQENLNKNQDQQLQLQQQQQQNLASSLLQLQQQAATAAKNIDSNINNNSNVLLQTTASKTNNNNNNAPLSNSGNKTSGSVNSNTNNNTNNLKPQWNPFSSSNPFRDFSENIPFLQADPALSEPDKFLSAIDQAEDMSANTKNISNNADSNSNNSNGNSHTSSSSTSCNNQQSTSAQPDKTAKFKEEYLVGKQVGQGAYACVRVALNKIHNKKVAIKIYEKEKIRDIQRKKSVKREVKLLQVLNHPNVIKIYDTIETNNHVNIITEYIPGQSLHGHLKAQSKRRLPEIEAKRIFFQIVSAIHYCHMKQICHRDIKLENILLDEKDSPKLIDFGFSTCIPNSMKYKMFCGTPSYMAPEIVNKQEYRGPPADIWALGVLLYALLCGTFPFKGQTDKELYTKISLGQFYEPEFLSTESKEFIHYILNVNCQERPTAMDLLNHTWMPQEEKVIMSGVQQNMQQFNGKNEESQQSRSYSNSNISNGQQQSSGSPGNNNNNHNSNGNTNVGSQQTGAVAISGGGQNNQNTILVNNYLQVNSPFHLQQQQQHQQRQGFKFTSNTPPTSTKHIDQQSSESSATMAVASQQQQQQSKQPYNQSKIQQQSSSSSTKPRLEIEDPLNQHPQNEQQTQQQQQQQQPAQLISNNSSNMFYYPNTHTRGGYTTTKNQAFLQNHPNHNNNNESSPSCRPPLPLTTKTSNSSNYQNYFISSSNIAAQNRQQQQQQQNTTQDKNSNNKANSRNTNNNSYQTPSNNNNNLNSGATSFYLSSKNNNQFHNSNNIGNNNSSFSFVPHGAPHRAANGSSNNASSSCIANGTNWRKKRTDGMILADLSGEYNYQNVQDCTYFSENHPTTSSSNNNNNNYMNNNNNNSNTNLSNGSNFKFNHLLDDEPITSVHSEILDDIVSLGYNTYDRDTLICGIKDPNNPLYSLYKRIYNKRVQSIRTIYPSVTNQNSSFGGVSQISQQQKSVNKQTHQPRSGIKKGLALLTGYTGESPVQTQQQQLQQSQLGNYPFSVKNTHSNNGSYSFVQPHSTTATNSNKLIHKNYEQQQ